jgi:hypothetical protein
MLTYPINKAILTHPIQDSIEISLRESGARINRPDKNRVIHFERRTTHASGQRISALIANLFQRGYKIMGKFPDVGPLDPIEYAIIFIQLPTNTNSQ